MGSVLTEKGLKGTFIKALDKWPTIYEQLCVIAPSTNDKEKYAWLGQMPSMTEWTDKRTLKQLSKSDYEIANILFEASVDIPQVDIDDDNLGALMIRIRGLAAKCQRHKDKMVLRTLIDGADAALCYDGQNFFDTDHKDPEASYQTNQNNDLTTNITAPTDPTAVEMHAALQDDVGALRGFLDSEGEPANPQGAKITLEGPPNFEWIFNHFVNGARVASQAATAAETNPWAGILAGYIINSWTANNERFRSYILDGILKPYVFQDREKLTTQILLAKTGTPNWASFQTHRSYFGVHARYNAGFGDWRAACLHIFT